MVDLCVVLLLQAVFPERGYEQKYKFFSEFSLQLKNKVLLLHHQNVIELWCNGNTTDSGPVIPGSSPGIPTKRCSLRVASFLCNNYKVSCQESLWPDNIGTENFFGSHL